ncbi:thermonuclease family protein [Kingella negevensis]|uniref:thermonuclease family protein n=1 Tax=Kingella negevensis TaxID=1522312 RepID=UPI002543E8F0|nr:thermonuclease family protein [Kingella negevensis]WII93568.1 thermonuclease family protein [Kingella negevensis]
MFKKILLSSLIAFAATAQAYTAKVISVHDGDTIRVIDKHGQKQRIRLANIDAPEINPAQAHGIASRDALRELINQQTVEINVVDVDKYGRQVAQIIHKEQDINLLQIQNGNAWHYQSFAKKNQTSHEYEQYSTAENIAKQDKIGLWAGKNPLAPWKFRHQNRQNLSEF